MMRRYDLSNVPTCHLANYNYAVQTFSRLGYKFRVQIFIIKFKENNISVRLKKK